MGLLQRRKVGAHKELYLGSKTAEENKAIHGVYRIYQTLSLGKSKYESHTT